MRDVLFALSFHVGVLLGVVVAVRHAEPPLHCLRDISRTVLCVLAGAKVEKRIHADAVQVRDLRQHVLPIFDHVDPLQEELNRVDMIKDRQDVLAEIAHLHSIGVNAFFNFGAGQDAKDSTRDIAQAVQGGLGMPDRDYYTKQDPDMKGKREKYIAHVTKMLTLLGEPAGKAAEDAKKIMALETKLAEASRTRVQLRDPIKNYNKMGVRQLQDLTPDWNWSDYFKKIDLVEPGDINVRQPEFFKAAANSFKSTPIDDWKAYLRWNLINATAPYLSKDFVDEEFDFNERTLRGTQQIKPRWKRVIASEDDAIGEALGKLYVGFYFPPEA